MSTMFAAVGILLVVVAHGCRTGALMAGTWYSSAVHARAHLWTTSACRTGDQRARRNWNDRLVRSHMEFQMTLIAGAKAVVLSNAIDNISTKHRSLCHFPMGAPS
jgi:hypothetical protein